MLVCLSAGGRQRAAVSFSTAVLSSCCKEVRDSQTDSVSAVMETVEGMGVHEEAGRWWEDGTVRRTRDMAREECGEDFQPRGCVFRRGAITQAVWASSEPLPFAGEQAPWRNSCVLRGHRQTRGRPRPLSHQSQCGPIVSMSQTPPPNSSLTF